MREVPSERIVRPSGRRVAVYRLAQGNIGRTILLCHPAPGAGTFDPDPARTWARGVTLLSVDRPGYGQSDPVGTDEWATVGAAADDLAALIEQIGGGSVGVAGWSAGGRVALALAARRPELADRVVVIGTPAPHEHVPWMPPELQAALEVLRGASPGAAREAILQQFAPLLLGEGQVRGLLGIGVADEAALGTPGTRERLDQMLAVTVAQGAIGLADDIAGHTLQPWGLDPIEVEAKTLLLYGAKDPIAGSKHGNWWQKHLPNARLEMVPNTGHLLIVTRWQRALSHLAPGVKRRN